MQSRKTLVLVSLLVAGLNAPAHSALQQFETLTSTRSTSVLTDQGPAPVRWKISSDVASVEASTLDASAPGVARFLDETNVLGEPTGPIYRYTYTFENSGGVAINFSFSDPRVVNSPLTEVLRDFAFALQPAQLRTVQFLSTYSPDFIISHVNNGIWDYQQSRWSVLGTRRASLYVPSWTGPIYVEVE